MSGITSHVLDTSRGKPAAGIDAVLEFNSGDLQAASWSQVGNGTTNDDGRIPELCDGPIKPGHYRINFAVSTYFESQKLESFYPVVRIEFNVADGEQHYHVPLLLNPFGYSTYRGS